MKRAERLAWGMLAALIAIMAILLTGGILYRFTAFWAGLMLAGGQAVAAALAGWGLMLAQQVSELKEGPATATGESGEPDRAESLGTGFRMSMGDDEPKKPIRGKRTGAVGYFTGGQSA